MLKVLRWIAVSFSLYSRIPMLRFAWEEDDMKHSMLFFPLVGLVIGGVIIGFSSIPAVSELPVFVRCAVTILIPVLITGGFHLDGFMDTEDALRSYLPRERKLEIMKDPHTGAFAVIGLVRCLLIMGASVGTILTFGSRRTLYVFAAVFVISRALAGMSATILPKAKKDGMLAEETGGKRAVLLTGAILWLITGLAVMLLADPRAGAVVAACFLLCLIRYGRMTAREFGGVTGDTTGYFVTWSETMVTLAVAVVTWLLKGA